MPNILEFLAQTHQSWIHPRGRAATRHLLDLLDAVPHDNLLEIGFGTGQTLVEAAKRWPGARLQGVERLPAMCETAGRRLRFCGVSQVALYQVQNGQALPFPDSFFDAVYAESVLAILPDDAIAGYFQEIARVLRPGGSFFNNESLWMSGLDPSRAAAINRQSLEYFGIQQASERLAWRGIWQDMALRTGLAVKETLALATVRPVSRWSLEAPLCSTLFSAMGWWKRATLPALRARRRDFLLAQARMNGLGPSLEAWLFHFVKPAV